MREHSENGIVGKLSSGKMCRVRDRYVVVVAGVDVAAGAMQRTSYLALPPGSAAQQRRPHTGHSCAAVDNTRLSSNDQLRLQR